MPTADQFSKYTIAKTPGYIQNSLRSFSTDRKKEITDAKASSVYLDLRSTWAVGALKHLPRVLEPRYQIPHYTSLNHKHIPHCYHHVKRIVQGH